MKDKNLGNYRRTRRNTEDNLNFGDIPEVSFSSCQRNLIKTFQIEAMIALSKYINVRKLFKGGNYLRAETIRGNTVSD